MTNQPTPQMFDTVNHMVDGHTSIKALARAAGVSESCIRYRLDQWGVVLGLPWGTRDKARIIVEAVKQGFIDIPRIAAMLLLGFAILQSCIATGNAQRPRSGTRTRREDYYYVVQRGVAA